ncbi:MAG TPA: ABC transporter ATP-binding protein [Salinimicrobium sp.]|nr:ABC transporter ATP-binding protein [Salinimicrobium sp.]
MAAEEKNKAILKTEKLSIGYTLKHSEKLIASEINFEVFPGELVAVIGANGMGKSTLLRTLSSIQIPLSGAVFLNRKNLQNIDSKELSNLIGLVLTEQPISKNLSVYELVALGRQPYTNWIGTLSEKDKEEVRKALKNVGIEDLAERRCYELSDGQLQKVLIARALAQDTSLVILDEPTTHLDLYHQAYIFKLLKKLVRETKKSMIFATHEINLAIQLCDKIIILNNEKFYFGNPCELIENGIFEQLFPSDLIQFDSNLGAFRIKSAE